MLKLVIASRKSDLARIQAQTVAKALQAAHPSLEVELRYRESLGDKNQQDPLWKMPEKGVFTQDFREDLLSETIDIVVHSWKDLPTEMGEGTHVAGALPRADQRDILLIKKSVLAQSPTQPLKILSSSPRRSHNLTAQLDALLPAPFGERGVVFGDIRGNVPTRVRKALADNSAAGLVLAKAGLDRLLAAEGDEYLDMRQELRTALEDFRWMVLPLSINPTAAAQGALALEIKSTRKDLATLLEPILCASTTAQVKVERAILKSHGGGCHQKIGVSVIAHPLGGLLSLKGARDDGKTLDAFAPLGDHVREAEPQLWSVLEPQISLLTQARGSVAWGSATFVDAHQQSIASAGKYFPKARNEWPEIFRRADLAADWQRLRHSPLMIARANTLPAGYEPGANQLLWTAGLETWKALAARGLWVAGTFDSLGESAEDLGTSRSLGISLASLAPASTETFIKLTHNQGTPRGATQAVYSLIENPEVVLPQPLSEWYFWLSGSAFLWALKKYPALQSALHACGPGNTLRTILEHIPSTRVRVYPSYQAWLSQVHAAANTGVKHES